MSNSWVLRWGLLRPAFSSMISRRESFFPQALTKTFSYSPAGNNHSKELHTLRVTATPGYSATTRWGYRTTGSDAPKLLQQMGVEITVEYSRKLNPNLAQNRYDDAMNLKRRSRFDFVYGAAFFIKIFKSIIPKEK